MKILLVDDHKLITEGMEALLQNQEKLDLEIVGKLKSGREAIAFIENNEVDIVIMDVNMPDMDGIKAAEIIKEHYQKVKIIFLSMHNKEGYAKNAAQIGVEGYLLKDGNLEELLEAIEKVNNGGIHYAEEVSSLLVRK